MRRAEQGVRARDVGHDLLDLRFRVAQALERFRHRLVDDLEVATAGQLLELHQRKIRSIPVVSQSIKRPIVPVGASTVACALR